MFDHRSSIIAYIDHLAGQYDVKNGRETSETGSHMRALSGSLAACLDVEAGTRDIASSVHAAIHETCRVFNAENSTGFTISQILAHDRTAALSRVRFAAMWVAKKRLGWTNERLAECFLRDRETVTHGLQRAEDFRSREPKFAHITDNLVEQPLRCEHCLATLETA